MVRYLTAILLVAALAARAHLMADSSEVAATENAYADARDAKSIVQTMDAGVFKNYRGKDRAAWERAYREEREKWIAELSGLPGKGLSAGDGHAVAVMRMEMKSFPETILLALRSHRSCADAQRKDLSYADMSAALVECFAENDKKMAFEGKILDRQSALDRLREIDEPERRRSLFLAFVPLWRSLNGENERGSPYRRLMAMAAADGMKNGSEIDYVARDVGFSAPEIERWLEEILDSWRVSTNERLIEPWDFVYRVAEAERMLAASIPLDSLRPINRRFYQDLGADLGRFGVLYDIGPRPGQTPVSETEFVTHGRMLNGKWKPAVARVSAAYSRGGLSSLNELVHENGHVINIMAIRNRPAFSDWPSDLFAEAFADVPGWSTYEPAWQRKYVGREAPEQISLRDLYAGVAMDVAWALFEMRMLRDPASDPNALWTEITSHYLHIVAHPEWPWWALRVQLVDSPGYMVNYGLGAVLTAEMRQQIRETLGPFDAGDARWYEWVDSHLLQYGSERSTHELMQALLGRPVSPRTLLQQIRRVGLTPAASRP